MAEIYVSDIVRRGSEVTIYGLPPNVTEKVCVQEFRCFGDIKDIERDPRTGSFTIAYQKFSEAAALEKYLKQTPEEANFVSPVMAVPINPMMNPMLGGAMMGGGPMMGNPLIMNMFLNSMGMGCTTPMSGLPVTRSPGGTVQPSPNFIRTIANAGSSPNPKSQSSDSSLENGHDLQTGPCLRCKRRTTYTCGRCGGFYCSRDCQKQDWSDHKTKCNNEMPMLNFAGRKLISEIELLDNDARASDALSPRSSTQESRGRDHRDQRGQRDNREQRVHREGRNQDLGDRMPDGRQTSSQLREQGGAFSDHRLDRRAGGTSGDDKNRTNSNGPNPRFSEQRNDSTSGHFSGDGQNHRQGDDGLRNRTQGSSFNQKFGPRNGNGGPRNQNDGDNRNGRRDGDRRQQGSHRGAYNFRKKEQKDRGECDFKDSKSTPRLEKIDVEVPVLKIESPHAEKIEKEVSVAKFESPPQTDKIVKEVSVAEIESPLCKQTAEVKESASVDKVSKLFAGLRLNRATATATEESAPKVEPKMPEARTDKPLDVSMGKGDKVIISHVADTSFYLQSLSSLQELAKLIGDLQEHCGTAPTLTRQPKKKEFLAAKSSADGSFYRAVVEARTDKDEQKYRVRYIDFGNEEDGVKCDRMVLLPDNLASIPCLAIETHLQGVPREPLVEEAAAIVKECNKNETPLKVEFTTSIKDGVTMKMDDGSSVNEKVLQALTPIPVPKPATTPTPVPAPASAVTPAPVKVAPAEPSKHYMYNIVENVPFPDAGTKINIMINYVQDEGVIMACPAIQSAIIAVQALNQKLMEYGPSAQPFRPQENEVCAAKWTDDCWYRAVCLELKENETFRLLFLEFGNIDEVKYPNIVPLTEELVREPALSSMCELSGPALTPLQIKKLMDLVNRQGWAGEAVVESNPKDNLIVLNIPGIRKEL